jgi:hypothetical protein
VKHSTRDIPWSLVKNFITILGVTEDEVHASAKAKMLRKKYMAV